MTLKSKLISIKNIEKGEKVGYDGTWQAKKRTKIGILPIGYGDGYPINLSNCGKVFLNGNLAPLIGKISMDMVAIDLSRIKKISYKDEVILWGKDHEVDTVAKYANNSPYSLMTGLTKRVKKVYKL
jgi:alanine racemase